MSIYRINTNQTVDSGMFFMHNREYSLDRSEQQINTGKKYRLPRENPIDVSQAMTMHTKMNMIDQYIRNIDDAEGERSLTESKMASTIEVLQRVRELAVQGANGIYTESDRRDMAMEIDQLLRQVITEANSKYKGDFLFSGYQKYTQPFETLEGAIKGFDEPMITQVKYLGDNGKHLREIDTGEYVAAVKPGSEVFWAEQFQVFSSVSTKDFKITKDQSILIDGQKIDLKAGDNIYAIIDKINQSPVAVNASTDIINGGLIIKSTQPHKLEMADIEGGSLLQDLGILEKGRPTGPENLSSTATVFGGSVFDALIGLRDSFLKNNMEDIGGRFLGAVDGAIENLTYRTAETGALSNRLKYMTERQTTDKMMYTENLTKLEDVDIADAVTNLKQLEYAKEASLSSIARLNRVSLMDYMK